MTLPPQGSAMDMELFGLLREQGVPVAEAKRLTPYAKHLVLNNVWPMDYAARLIARDMHYKQKPEA